MNKAMKCWIMPRKILAFDLETSGIGEKFGLMQFAAKVFIDGKFKDSINIRIKLFESDLVDKKALEVTGLDPRIGVEPLTAHKMITSFFSAYINKFDKNDKFTPLAQNGNFDLDHLNFFFNKCGDKYFGSWQNFNLLDPLPFFRMLRYLGLLDLPDLKLGTICDFFGIEIKAHDALSDIEATIKLAKIVMEHMKSFNINKYKK